MSTGKPTHKYEELPAEEFVEEMPK